jgi:hypothetical protein
MTLLGKLSKHMQNAGVNSEGKIAADAYSVRYAIRQEKPNTVNFMR